MRQLGIAAIVALVVTALVLGPETRVGGQEPRPGAPAQPAPGPQPPAKAPRRVTMEELHRSGGVPRGWAFTLPAGDAVKGRQVFVDLECYKCHAIKGQDFPDLVRGAGDTGPEMTGMGRHHPAEYFAESILAPNEVIVDGPGYTGPDGLSIMPSYADTLSVAQLVDLVAFLKAQTQGGQEHAHAGAQPGSAPGQPAAETAGGREKVIGEYRIRLVYKSHAHEHGAQPGHGHGAAPPGTPGPGHLMAFIAAADTGDPVPYLPVRATFFVSGKPPRTVKLAPMVGSEGFHYGADVAIPEGTDTIRLNIGAAALTTIGSVKGRFSKATTAVFEWR